MAAVSMRRSLRPCCDMLPDAVLLLQVSSVASPALRHHAEFGVSAHTVRQRLRLASVSTFLIQAYRDEELTWTT